MSAVFGIVIPTLNRADLLEELMDVLIPQSDYYNEIYIIDNGKQNLKYDHPKIQILEQEQNIGVGPSWNMGMNKVFSNPMNSFSLFLNDDIVLGATQLATIEEILKFNRDKWLLYGPYYWSVFGLSRDCWLNLQYQPGKVFDESFYPAYFEDNDFHYRLKLKDASKDMGGISDFTPEVCRNSMTKEKDSSVTVNFEKNKQYYVAKWGGEPAREKYKKPFNK